MKKLTLALFLIMGILSYAGAQETGDVFAHNIVRVLTRLGWSTSETGAFERWIYTYEWKNTTGADPEIVAAAVSYGKERGIDSPEDLAGIAYQLSMSMQEINRLGLEPREILRVSMNAVRAVSTARLESGKAVGEATLSRMLREQIRNQTERAGQSSLRRKTGQGVSGASRSDTWEPPSREDRNSGGSSNVPDGPPGPAGPGSDIFGGNGGR